MESIQNYIHEKLVLNKELANHYKNKHKVDREHWSITNAQDGDIVVWNDTLWFIYKCLNQGSNRINNTGSNTIIYHAYYLADNRKKLVVGIDTGVGDISKPDLFKLATEEQYQEFYQALDKEGYKWDNIHKKIVEK